MVERIPHKLAALIIFDNIDDAKRIHVQVRPMTTHLIAVVLQQKNGTMTLIIEIDVLHVLHVRLDLDAKRWVFNGHSSEVHVDEVFAFDWELLALMLAFL